MTVSPEPTPAPAPPAKASFLKKLLARTRRLVPVARFLYSNRKAEIALATAVLALGREVVQIATGH